MAYEKQNFLDGQVLTAQHLNRMEEGIQTACDAVDDQIGRSGTGANAEIFNDYDTDYCETWGHIGNVASGDFAHAEGERTQANGQGSHAEGGGAKANGKYSHAEGAGTTADGNYSHAEGADARAEGDFSHAEGHKAVASGESAHAEGINTSAGGKGSHTEGLDTKTEGQGSHAEGVGTIATGNYQHVEGRYNVEDAEGKYAHIVGNGADGNNRSNAYTLDWQGNAAFAGRVSGAEPVSDSDFATKKYAQSIRIGRDGNATGAEEFNAASNVASGKYSHAEGHDVKVAGEGAHAEGGITTASGAQSHAEGFKTVASGLNAHAEGRATQATAEGAHSEGGDTKAHGIRSHAEGHGTIARGDYSHVEGKFNIEDTEEKYAHIVGNGESNNKRSNAHTVDWGGNAWYAGTVEATAIILRSPNGTRFSLGVNDDGTLVATAL